MPHLRGLSNFAIITLRGREAWYLARPITLRSLVQIQPPQFSYYNSLYRPIYRGGLFLGKICTVKPAKLCKIVERGEI